MQKTIVYLQIDGVKGYVCDATGNRLSTTPSITRGLSCILAYRFLHADGTAYTVAELADLLTWYFAVANDWDTSTTPQLDSSTVSVVAVSDDDFTGAEVQVTLADTNTAELIAAIGTSESMTLGVELDGFLSGQTSPGFVLLSSIVVYNRRTLPGTGSPTSVADGQYTAVQINSLLASGVKIQFGPDGSTDWSDTQRATDYYLHMSFDQGANYGIAIKIPTGPAGTTGTNGTGYVPKGAYSAATTYALNEAVTYNGSLYASIIAGNLGNEPDTSTAAWLLIVSKGKDGAAGAAGADGAAGEAGADAPEVEIQFSADNESWHDTLVVDADEYIRFSVDGGITWSSGKKFVGDKGATGAAGATGATGAQGEGLHADIIKPYSQIGNYDSEAEGFMFLASDTACLYRKNSATAGDWSDPTDIKGEDGTAITIATTLPASARLGDFCLIKTGITGELYPLYYYTLSGWTLFGNLKSDSYYFTPSINASTGMLSWINNGKMDNPASVRVIAYNVQIQYSADCATWKSNIDTGWSDTYIRFSVDGGTTWSSGAYLGSHVVGAASATLTAGTGSPVQIGLVTAHKNYLVDLRIDADGEKLLQQFWLSNDGNTTVDLLPMTGSRSTHDETTFIGAFDLENITTSIDDDGYQCLTITPAATPAPTGAVKATINVARSF